MYHRSISVLLNTGTGLGTATTRPLPVDLTRPLAVGDFNGDGTMDIAGLMPSSEESAMPVLLNDGTGSFSVGGIYAVHMGTTTLAAGDVDGDGRPDLVTNGEILRNNLSSVPISLVHGWNLIGVPLLGVNSMATLATSINTSLGTSGSVSVVATYGGGRFALYVPGYSADQPLSPGQGIFVRSTGTGTWKASGPAYFASPPVQLQRGWNLVAAASPSAGLSAGKMAAEIDPACASSACSVKAIVKYINGAYVTYIPGGSGTGTSFTVLPTDGVWIQMSTPTTWTPH
jgi:hypothetical protein